MSGGGVSVGVVREVRVDHGAGCPDGKGGLLGAEAVGGDHAGVVEEKVAAVHVLGALVRPPGMSFSCVVKFHLNLNIA